MTPSSHAAAAGEMLWAARIIEQHFDMVYNIRGEAATIHRWLSVLPAEVVRSRPRLLLAQALMAATSGHIEVVEPLLDAVECAPPGWADEPFEPTAGVAASHLINVPALTTLLRGYLAQLHGDAEATAAFATQALAESKPEERLLSAAAHGFLAVAEWLRGRLTEAERAFASSVTGWRETGQLTITAWGYYELALIRRAQGRLDAAALTCEQALDSLVTSGRPLPAAGPSYVGPGRDRLPAGRTRPRPAARHRGHRAVPPVRLHPPAGQRPGHAGDDPAGHRRSGRGAGGDHRGRTGLTRPGGPAQPGPGPAGPAAAGPGRPARQRPVSRRRTASARTTSQHYAREPGHLVLARILLAQDRPGQALALLDRLHAAAPPRTGPAASSRSARCGRWRWPPPAMKQARSRPSPGRLLLACPQGYVRVFADEGPPMAALLGRLIAAQRTGQAAAGVPLGYLARLQRAFGPGRPAHDPARSGIIDPLTSRELEVLEMLAAGRSNQAIARELVVTLDTVKKHVGHVLGKLGAANRTEAVARARELGLIA